MTMRALKHFNEWCMSFDKSYFRSSLRGASRPHLNYATPICNISRIIPIFEISKAYQEAKSVTEVLPNISAGN